MGNLNLTIYINACQSKTRLVLAVGDEFADAEISDSQAMESFVATLAKLLERNSAKICDIKKFAICTGPGSILGTRTASVAACAIAQVSGAEIYVWDIMKASAYALAQKLGEIPFKIVAPSRKGYVNILVFDGEKIVSETEAEIEKTNFENARMLKQRDTPIKNIPDIPVETFTPKEIFNALKRHGELLERVDTPPDAKSLSERNYAKWKAPALI